MKATIKFNTLFVTSAYDIATLKKVQKFRPDALVLTTGEGKEKKTVSAITVGSKDEIGKFGISFANDTNVGEKVAVLSRPVPADLKTPEAIHNWVNEAVGLTIVNGMKIEDQIAAAMDEIAADEDAMNAAITIEGDAQPENPVEG